MGLRPHQLVETNPEGPAGEPQQYTPTTLTAYPNKDTVLAQRDSSGASGEPVPETSSPSQRNSLFPELLGLTPGHLLELAPRLSPYVPTGSADLAWPAIVDAAGWLGGEMGISRTLWARACLVMGRPYAAVAMALVSTRQAGHFTSSPGGYFAGIEGRYRRGGENADDYARGARQWTAPWGNHGGNDFINIFPHGQYCLKYGGKHDDLAPFVVNQHRNGLLTPWGYNATHQVPQLTTEDYVNSRYILNPLRLWDCDRPVNASAAYLFTTTERARDMRQSPVYVLNHSQHNFRKRSTQEDLDEIEDWTDRAAKRMYEGAGLGPKDVDIFNPYDGYAPMAQFFLEGFQWHGVKRGDAFAFYAGDIRVEGPHPFCSSGGNLGNGRTRTAMYTDSIEQLRRTAGARQVRVRAETALAAFTTPSSGGWIMFGKSPG